LADQKHFNEKMFKIFIEVDGRATGTEAQARRSWVHDQHPGGLVVPNAAASRAERQRIAEHRSTRVVRNEPSCGKGNPGCSGRV